ncbi:VOC family protein [Rhizobium leguminosarum]|uniref:VOC family protein n=1 Tax=Rhizobium leguminosarum TaxID=384 RepID=UPI00036542E2|nr:VOC family protein [Rhizobium leguminosarum]NKL55016.1 VOC family protein [Rhizobium leguminosarum bv. viciae]WSH69098.1 VOC family protein [Rhizobium ruizarguesonis]
MIHIDHVCLGTRNLWEGTERLRAETGLGFYEGGWFPKLGLANKIFPTGGDTYIEVESVVDVHEYESGNPAARFFRDKCRDGDVFIGWCARVDSREELEQLARRLGSDVFETGLRQRADGTLGVAIRTPETIPCWKVGLPNFFYVADITKHPSRMSTQHGTKTPLGLSWLELGGTEEEMNDYLGMSAASLNLRFNGGAHGLHAMGVSTTAGEVEIRRNVLSGTTGKL